MKQKNLFLKITLFFFLSISSITAQSRGDIAFTAINVDGDDDFAIVTLADIAANSTIYFTDYEWDETNTAFTETGTDGFLRWNTGGAIIEAGTVVIFTDVDNSSNTNYGVSIGSLTSPENVALLASGETLFAYIGTDKDTPTTFITGIKNGSITTDLNGTALGGTDLAAGTDFLEFNPTTSPDGGFFSSSRSNQASYSSYLSILTNESNWTRNTTNGELLLPFTQEAFTTSTTIWDGSTDEDWSDPTNWSNGVPTIDANVSIPNTGNAPEIKTGTSALAGNITIDADASLEVTQSLTVKGLTTINSSSSNSGTFKVTGTYDGYLKYNRNIPNAFTSWYLVSAPVHNYSVVDYATQNSLQQGSGSGDAQNIALAMFDNSQALVANRWSYYRVGETDHASSSVDTEDELNAGQGFSTSLSTAGTLTFEGTLQTSDVTRTITLGAGGGGTNFNLVGNPYPSYLNSNTFMTNNSNITTTIWVWNQGLNSYQTKNLASNFQVAPGQGFFVEANSGVSVLLEKSTLSHESTNTFQKSANSYIKILINSEGIQRESEIYYLSNATKGFDNGYDGKVFGGIPESFSLFSHLISNSDGTDYAIQSLPNSDYENMIIPIGLKATADKEIAFTIKATNLPSSIKVFLEDRKNNTFTRLDEANSEYKITTDTAIDGIGRFYLHTKSSVLNIEDVNMDNISIYKTSNSNLKITGLTQGKASVKLFNILGKQVLKSSFTSNGIYDISIPNLSSGIYIVQLETKNGKLNKKITLE